MRVHGPLLALVLLGALPGAVPRASPRIAPAPGARRYEVDPGGSRVVVHVGKAGLFSFAGHEHEVSALGFSGEVVADESDLGGSSVRLSFPAASLKLVTEGESPTDVPKIDATMTGPRVLDTLGFPEILYESRSVKGRRREGGAWTIEVEGELRLRATVHSLTLKELQVEITEDTLVASGRATLKQTDFGIAPVSVAGVVKVKDELVIEYRIVARAHPASSS
jgi:polyisoprenoid-binding protein YceI